jgi:hypothetical protein
MIIASPMRRSAFRLVCLVAFGIVAATTTTTARAQESFKTPAEAATALVEAARGNHEKRLRAILGVVGRDSLHSGDDVADAADRKRFLEAYDSRHSISEHGGKTTLLVGPDDFPFPIPIMRRGEGWTFDGISGRDEILARRVGRNEFAAMQASLAFLDAQQEYAAKDRTGQGRGLYAQRIVSRPGARDGLYWESAAGEEPSPLGELAAEAAAEGYRAGETRQPFHGYYYKILKRQGGSAPGGAIDYVAGGKMIGGFALLAYPAEYGRSGLISFMLNHAGTVYQKDLGPGTARIAARMQSFNPDKGWEKVTPQN